jgi:glucose-1-phosphate thymidylyltransferase
MRGIVLAGGKGTRLWPITASVSKQLLPIYDKPLIFYPLATLFLAQIRDILIITTPSDLESFQRLLGNGEKFGVNFSFAIQEQPGGLAQAYLIGEKFLSGEPSALILGDNIFHGAGLGRNLVKTQFFDGARIFTYVVANPEAYGVLTLDEKGKPINVVEKPIVPPSNLAVTGLYFFDGQASEIAKTLKPSARGELEITGLINHYFDQDEVVVTSLPRGTAWLDTGNANAMHDAGTYVRVLEERTGEKIAVLEEIAFLNGWIGVNELKKNAEAYGINGYSEYLSKIPEKYQKLQN